MARKLRKSRDRETKLVERHVSEWMEKSGRSGAKVSAFRIEPYGFVRLRIVHADFLDKSLAERDDMLRGMMRGLPADVDHDVSMILAIAPEELKDDPVNAEFEAPERASR